MKYHLVAMLVFCFAACMNRDDVATTQSSNEVLRPGTLQLAPMASAKTGVHGIPVQDTASSVYEFDLGTANSSMQRFFILKNLGDRDVHDIVLTTDNPHFYFSPSHIKVLQPSKTTSVFQVITLNVIHGNRLDGLGYDSLLPMGDNFAGAHIAGSTTNGSGDSLGVGEEAGFHVFASVMDLKFYKSDGSEADMSGFGLDYGTMQEFTTSPVRTYWYMGGAIKIANTGNASFSVRIWHLEGEVPVFFDSLEMQRGDTCRLDPAYIEIDGHGVVTNPSKLYLQPDRNDKIYMSLY